MKQRARKRRIRILTRLSIFLVAALMLCGFSSLTKAINENKTYTQEVKTEIIIERMSNEEVENVEKTEVQTLTFEAEPINLVIEEPVKIIPMISAYGPGEVYFYNLTWEEKILVAKVVFAESRGECFEGQVAVAAVVLNRYVSNDRCFERDSIESVVRQAYQFASIDWISMEELASVPSCMEAVEAACKGWDPTREVFEEGAKYFYAPDGISEEAMARREGVLTMNIGNHAFHNDFN